MVQLTFLEEVKDKASRLIPSAYVGIVEECTAPNLTIPIYEHVMFLCASANNKPESLGDIVRALRRRITDNNPAVKHLLIMLLDAMIKNCGLTFHVEMCSQKGLLRDLENVATTKPTCARGMQTKEAAMKLILNLSVWFVGHPDQRCHILTTLASDVRAVVGPDAFDGVRPDTSVRLRVTAPAAGPTPPRPGSAHQSRHGGGGRERPPIVDAIPIDLPKEDQLSAMLDICMTFSEYINNIPVNDDGTISRDDVVHGFAAKIAEDRRYVTTLLSSNLKLNRDVLTVISQSQTSVLNRLDDDTARSSHATDASAPDPARRTAPPAAGTVPMEKIAQSSDASPLCKETTSATAPSAPAPSTDDIFGTPAEAPLPSTTDGQSASSEVQPASTPHTPSTAHANASDAPAVVPPGERGNAPEKTTHHDTAMGTTRQKEDSEETFPAAEEQKPTKDTSRAAAPAAPPVDDDDDFDAFLDGR